MGIRLRKPAWTQGQILSASDLDALTDYASPRVPIAFAEGAAALIEIAESESIVKLSTVGAGVQDLIVPRGRFFVEGRYVDTTDLTEDERRARLGPIPDGTTIDAFLTFSLRADKPGGRRKPASGTLAYRDMPNLTLVEVDSSVPGALHIARFTREAGAVLVPVENFVPPCMRLDSLPEMKARLSRKFAWVNEPADLAAARLRHTDTPFTSKEWRLEAVVRLGEQMRSALALQGASLADVYRLVAIAVSGARRALTEGPADEDIPWGVAGLLRGHTLDDVFELADLQDAIRGVVQRPIVADERTVTVLTKGVRQAGNLTTFSSTLESSLRKTFPTESMLTITLKFGAVVLDDDTWASCHPEAGPNALGPPYNKLKLRKIDNGHYAFELPFGDNETADEIGAALGFKVTISEKYDGPRPTIAIGAGK